MLQPKQRMHQPWRGHGLALGCGLAQYAGQFRALCRPAQVIRWRQSATSMAAILKAHLVDITTLTVDAIVNAANSDLAPGGGVCGAIHAAAGPELALACRTAGPCPTGEARITPGFRLRARFVIHAVGPIWYGGTNQEADLLASAYRFSMQLAQRHKLASIAFPAISTGIYGYPLDLASEIAAQIVREELLIPNSLNLVTFACFSPAALTAYARLGIEV